MNLLAASISSVAAVNLDVRLSTFDVKKADNAESLLREPVPPRPVDIIVVDLESVSFDLSVFGDFSPRFIERFAESR